MWIVDCGGTICANDVHLSTKGLLEKEANKFRAKLSRLDHKID